MKNPLKTRAGKFAAAAGIAGALTIAGTAVANANPGNDHRHTPGETSAGAPGMVDLSTLNGCDNSTTKKLTVTIPKEINEVRVRSNAAYEVNKVTEPLANPVTDEHGKTIKERVAKVEFTAKDTKTSNDKRNAPRIGVKTPEDAAGKTLYFPTVQTCENGETAWTDTPKDGEQAAHPAPKLKVTEKKADDKRPDRPANGAPEDPDHRPDAKDGNEQGPDGKDGQREGGRGHRHGGPHGHHKPSGAPDGDGDHFPGDKPGDAPEDGPDGPPADAPRGDHMPDGEHHDKPGRKSDSNQRSNQRDESQKGGSSDGNTGGKNNGRPDNGKNDRSSNNQQGRNDQHS